jgi:hypothetical protein
VEGIVKGKEFALIINEELRYHMSLNRVMLNVVKGECGSSG